MSDTKSKSKYLSSNVDQSALVGLQAILGNFQHQKSTAPPGEKPSLNQISAYFSNRSIIGQLTQIFSFASTINNHTDIISCSNSFSELINLSSQISELHQYVKPLIDDLISSSNIKVFYRCLNIHRPNITNPVLRLMTSIVTFNNGSYVDPFLEIFDLSLKSLPHLLIPLAAEKINTDLARSGKQSVRRWMVKFWLAISSNASSITRNDLLSNNKKIMSHLFKYMPTYDSVETIKSIVEFCDLKILMEPAYRKATKGKILNEWALSKIAEVFQRNELNTEIKDFFVKATTDDEYGLSFQDVRTFFLTSPSMSQDNGALINVGEKSFRISNKLVYILLTHLTPWSDIIQLDLTLDILSHIPELIGPYTAHIFFNHGTHEPRLTAFYIGQSLLLTRILLLPVPLQFKKSLKEFVHDLDPTTNNSKLISKYLSSDHLSNSICPPMFTRGVLVKGLNSPDGLIRMTTAQLIVATTKRYHDLMETLSIDENTVLSSVRLELREIFLQRIPEASSIVGIVNEVLTPNPEKPIDKVLLITLLKLVENYQNFLEINVPVTLGNFGKLIGVDLGEGNSQQIEQKELSNIDMLLLNTYLELISSSFSDSTSKNKWWNISKGSNNTLFTIIGKLPWTLKENDIINNDLVSKSVKVLQSFTQDKLIFESDVLESQCWAIVLSMLRVFKYKNGDSQVIDTICKIIDESISRCIKTPYKYIDMSTALSKDKRLSPYFFTLCEQSKFSNDDQKETVLEFINVISAYFHILGEPLELMNLVIKKYWDVDLSFDRNSFEKYINQNSDLWNVSKDNSCFFDMISYSKIDSLRSIVNSTSVVCKSVVDSVSLIGRLNNLIYSNDEKKYQLEKIENLIVDITSVWGNYAIHMYNQSVTDCENSSILDSKFWKVILFQEGDIDAVTDKKYFVLGLLNEVFSNLWNFDSSKSSEKQKRFKSLRTVVIGLLDSLTSKSDNRVVSRCSELMWVLNKSDVLNYLQIATVKSLNSKIIQQLLIISLEKNIIIDDGLFIKLIAQVDESFAVSLSSLVKNITFSKDTVQKLVELTSKSPFYYDILNSICTTKNFDGQVIVDLLKENVSIIIQSASGFNLIYTLSSNEESFIPLLVQKSVDYIKQSIESNKIDISILPYLKPFRFNNIDKENVLSIIDTLSKIDSFKNDASLIFSQEITNLISRQGSNLPLTFIRSWIHRATLFITKMFAESDVLPSQFTSFIESLNDLFLNGMFWSNISKQMIDSQLETILSNKWIKEEVVVKYTTLVLMTAPKHMVDSHRQIAFYLNNPQNPIPLLKVNESLRFNGCLLLWYLIKSNKKVANTDLLLKVIKMYRGTNRGSDSVLKRILVELEETLRTSWAEYVTTWDFVEELDLKNVGIIPDLVISTPGIANGLTINLNKSILTNTIRNFNPFENVNVVDYEGKNKREEWNQWIKFQEIHSVYDNFVNGEPIYDIEFILLLICNNDELFNMKIEEDSTAVIVVNLRALIDSGLFQLCVMSLGHESKTIQQIASKLLASAYKWNNTELEMIEKFREQKSRPNNTSAPNGVSEETEVKLSQFKERSMFKVVLGNILFTIQDKESELKPSTLVMVMWGHLMPILANPAHFLYEKAYRFLLLGSKIKPFELPLYKSITEQQKDQYGTEENDDSDYYKEMEWILTTITDSVTSNEDLKVLKRANIFEYVMNLSQSPFVKANVMELIKKFIEKIITLENGADLLIRSYGLLSGIENHSILNEMNVKMKGDTDKWSEVGVMALIGSQFNGKDKRSFDWTDGDYERVIKRVCK